MVERRRRITAAVQYGCLLMQRLWHAVLYIVCGVEREPSSISTQIARWNAGLELHPVITQDGITLTMHRIVPDEDKGSRKGANNPPVLLLHGLFESSVVWTAQVGVAPHTPACPSLSLPLDILQHLNMHCPSICTVYLFHSVSVSHCLSLPLPSNIVVPTILSRSVAVSISRLLCPLSCS